MSESAPKELTNIQEVYQYLDSLNIDIGGIIEPVENSIQDVIVSKESIDLEQSGNDTAHFRFTSFGDFEDTNNEKSYQNESLDMGKLLDTYENVIYELKELEYKVKEAKIAHIEESEEWEKLKESTDHEVEKIKERNNELREMLAIKELDVQRIRDDIKAAREELNEKRENSKRFTEIFERMNNQLAKKDVLIQKQLGMIISLRNEEEMHRHSPLKLSPGSPEKALVSSSIGKSQGSYVTPYKLKPEDVGKQEITMPLLSKSVDNWVASFRSYSPSPRATSPIYSESPSLSSLKYGSKKKLN
ncbi:unnamed protein product [Blepharisma stoltei]|uniref:Uncharacterized protein n=1 Tax=Blepharisma stoltei TaxID=1481888 RepID=A0AAU9JJI3_9CILI|nr:unnamed protein product [Blepharisma stoltei]